MKNISEKIETKANKTVAHGQTNSQLICLDKNTSVK